MRKALTGLDVEDDEHPDVSLTHESEWCLSAFSGGLLIWENLEDEDPRHLKDVSRAQVLELWLEHWRGNVHLNLADVIEQVVRGGVAAGRIQDVPWPGESA